MNTIPVELLLALGGYLFHILKMWYESTKRNEAFISKAFYISIPMNILAICLLVYVGKTLPPELIVMSPITCITMGFMGSSILAGFINVKKPKDIIPDDVTTIPPNPGNAPKP